MKRMLIIMLLPITAAVLLGGVFAGGASAKGGPRAVVAKGVILADYGWMDPCLTAANPDPGAHVSVAPCTKDNGLQEWTTLRIHAVIIVGLTAHPGSCLGAVPQTRNIRGRSTPYAVLYNCGGGVSLAEGLTLGDIGGKYNTIVQTFKPNHLLTVTRSRSGPRPVTWRISLPSQVQVWLFPPWEEVPPF